MPSQASTQMFSSTQTGSHACPTQHSPAVLLSVLLGEISCTFVVVVQRESRVPSLHQRQAQAFQRKASMRDSDFISRVRLSLASIAGLVA